VKGLVRKVAVVGTGQTKHGNRTDVTLEEMAFEAVREALNDAGLTRKDIDAVIFGSGPDAFTGVNCPDQWCVGVAGALNRPYIRVNTGGTTGSAAAVAGYYHVASGLFDTVLVLCLERMHESPSTQYIFNTIFDPIYERHFALNTISMWAMAATQHMRMYGTTQEHMAKVSVRCHLNALNNPYAHVKMKITVEDVLNSRMLCYPIKLLDTCPRSDGACAIILASEEKARKITDTPAWIRGIGCVSDTYFLGDRPELCYRVQLALAAKKAARMARLENLRRQIQVAEMNNPFTICEMIAIESVGFCGKGESGKFIDEGIPEMSGELPINPSGGVLCTNPIGATSLIRVAEAALQVMGKAGKRQVPNVENALVQTSGGTIQFGMVMILSRSPPPF